MDPRLAEHLHREQAVDRRQDILEAQRRIDQGERPWEHRQGPEGVLEAVRDFRFPTTADELASGVGWRQVRLDDGRHLGLREVLEALGPDQAFLSLADFQGAVERHWPAIEGRGRA